MSLARSVKQYLGVRPINPPNVIYADRAPISTDTAYVKGDIWEDLTGLAVWSYAGGGVWIALGTGATGGVVTLTGGSGGAISPLAGNISILGTANQLTSTGSAGGHSITFSIPATFIAPGSIASTTTITSGTSLAVTTSATVGTTLGVTGLTTLGTLTQVGTANINASGSGVTTIGTGGTGAVNIGNATGNTAITGSATASTTLTATAGAITATNGNFVGSASGTGVLFNSPTATGAAASPLVLNGRTGAAVFSSVSIAAAADLTLTITNSAITNSATQVVYSLAGATTGSALQIKSVTNSAGSSAIVVTNGTGATTSTANITLTFIVLN